MMKNTTKYMSILALALASLLVAAGVSSAVSLQNIGVTHDGDSVVVTLSLSGEAQYNAFMIEKKPERIVIDLDNVANSISQIDFANLPFKSIHAIRTSQFKTEPTLQARVVLNVRRAVTFRTYRDGNNIMIKLPAIANEDAFSAWNAVGENSNIKLSSTEIKKEEPKPVPAAIAEPAPEPSKIEIAEKPPAEPVKEIAAEIPQEKIEAVQTAETKPEEKPEAPPQPKVETTANEPINEAPAVANVPEPAAPIKEVETSQSAAASESVESDDSDPQPMSDEAYAEAPAEEPNIEIEPSAKRQTLEYDSGERRDPFAPLIGSGVGKKAQGLPSLENLKLVGILEDIELNRALLEDADGNGYMMKPNDKVRDGYLVSVTDNKAIFQVTEYGWTRTVALELEIPEVR